MNTVRFLPFTAFLVGVFCPVDVSAESDDYIITPKNGVMLQRGFVPFEGELRLYACVVGTPDGLHYAYDIETGALLSVWRGPFVDVSDMWGPQLFNQTARPAGDQVLVSGKPVVALFPSRMMDFPTAWPKSAVALYISEGYELEPNGQPVFLATLENLRIRDRISVEPNARGFTRRIEFSGRFSPWATWLMLGEADVIEPASDGADWVASGFDWKIQWPHDSPHRPTVRTERSRQQLVVRLHEEALTHPIIYTLLW